MRTKRQRIILPSDLRSQKQRLALVLSGKTCILTRLLRMASPLSVCCPIPCTPLSMMPDAEADAVSGGMSAGCAANVALVPVIACSHTFHDVVLFTDSSSSSSTLLLPSHLLLTQLPVVRGTTP